MGDTAMAYPSRKTAFILASTNHGTMIVNRFVFGAGMNVVAVQPDDPASQILLPR